MQTDTYIDTDTDPEPLLLNDPGDASNDSLDDFEEYPQDNSPDSPETSDLDGAGVSYDEQEDLLDDDVQYMDFLNEPPANEIPQSFSPVLSIPHTPPPPPSDPRFDFGFVITRHVNSAKTNEYWNQCVKLLRTHYPYRPIVIIDDNSNPHYVVAHHPYKNVTVYSSEYPQRGELLPYLYYFKYKWWKKAVFIHDSVFIHRRFPFERVRAPVISLWHHPYDRENFNNLLRIASHLNHATTLRKRLSYASPRNHGMFGLSFGGQCVIQLSFLEHLQNKYNLFNLVNAVHCRTDRCGLERILGLLFAMECSSYAHRPSLFGEIHRHHRAFSYPYEDYHSDFKTKRIPQAIVKVWTGR